MCLNLNDCQFKTSRYNHKSTYMNPLVTTNQEATIDTQRAKREEHKHTTKENHQTTREEKEEMYRKELKKQLENK